MKYLRTLERYFHPKDNIKPELYEDKFFISIKTDFSVGAYVILVDRLELSMSLAYKPKGHYFNMNLKLNVIKQGIQLGSWINSYSKDELDRINFMTPIEFYEQYPQACEAIYDRVFRDYINGSEAENHDDYKKSLINFKNKLESIPKFKPYIDLAPSKLEIYNAKLKFKKDTIKYNL